MKQENLLPGTRALPRGTVEWSSYKGRELIRYRRLDGETWQRITGPGEAAKFFQECVKNLAAVVQGEIDG
jgi:hypothetical protein